MHNLPYITNHSSLFFFKLNYPQMKAELDLFLQFLIVHMAIFIIIIIFHLLPRFISSTLGDIVNLNREADMVSTFFFLDSKSLFLFGHFSAVTTDG